MSNVLSAILAVFTSVAGWIGDAVQALIPMFYDASEGGEGLTFLGVLAVAGLSISVVLLVFNIIKDFLRFR